MLHKDCSCKYLEQFNMTSSDDILNATILCKNHSRFDLYKIKYIRIHGLNFQQGCGGNKFAIVKELQIHNSTFVDSLGAALQLKKTNTTI